MSQTRTMISPIKNETFIALSGTQYQADASGVITNVIAGDVVSLLNSGCVLAGNITDPLPILSAKNTTGASLGASATGGAMGYSITLGTSAALVGEATSASAKTDVCLFEYILPSSYVGGTDLNLIINTNYTGSGTVTAASCTITPTVYAEANAGTQDGNLCSVAQQISGTATDYTFTVTGSTLNPGQRIMIGLSLLVTSASGANTGQVNSIRVQIP